MGTLTYATNMSLDGYIEDATGAFALYPHDDEVFAASTALIRKASTLLYGRRLYDAMAVWETDASLAAQPGLFADFSAAWQDADKVVWSTTLAEPTTRRTRVERAFDPAAVRALKEETTGSLTVGGAGLAAQALAAGLVDECRLFVWPSVLGGGKPALPLATRTDLELLDERRFGNGTVELRYRVLT